MRYLEKKMLQQKRADEAWERLRKYEKESIFCSECSSRNTIYDDYCRECGHKLKKISEKNRFNRKYCKFCGSPLDKNSNYCGECGKEISKETNKMKICSVCGEWIGNDRYCSNCGHDTIKRRVLLIGNKYSIRSKDLKGIDVKLRKKCPNCNAEHQIYFNYCEQCGTKLIKK